MNSERPRSWSTFVLPLLPVLALTAGCGHAAAQTSSTQLTAADTAAPSAGLDTASLVERVKASVVNITVESTNKRTSADGAFDSPFEFFFRNGPGGGPSMPRKQHALGSGFIFDDKGHVLTNAHVVDGADVVKVKLADERELRAKVKGRDERLDVAVLEIEGAKALPFASFGASGTLRVGEPVVAIGNPFGLGHTVTTGIVSAKGRAIGAGPYDDFIQTDASINPGNSGGPLFDAQGRVIGMNTAINPAGQGIGFAIPSDEIREILPQLVADGHVKRGRLGVMVQEIDQNLAAGLGLGDTRGALVGDVEKGGPAERAGLTNGDVIVKVGDAPIGHARDLSRTIARHAPGTKVDVVIRRGRETKTVAVALAALEDTDRNGPRSSSRETPGDASGLGLQIVDAEGGGALVRGVAPDGPSAGSIQPGDVIVEADRKPVTSANDLRTKVREAPAGKPLLLRVKRGDSSRYVAIERR
ncbi:MAG TPA: Do family serine endopeptidase [Labilithrix sp.]|nr:Do family serine endopeptidase [Labilithrix sp.]